MNAYLKIIAAILIILNAVMILLLLTIERIVIFIMRKYAFMDINFGLI